MKKLIELNFFKLLILNKKVEILISIITIFYIFINLF